jgi:hypothetical protein
LCQAVAPVCWDTIKVNVDVSVSEESVHSALEPNRLGVLRCPQFRIVGLDLPKCVV